MKKMLSKILALTLVVALGLGLMSGAFAATPQTGTFDLESLCTDYGQPIVKAIVNLKTPVGDVTEEEVMAAFTVNVLDCNYNMYGTVLTGDQPRTIVGAEVSEDGKTITLLLDESFAESTLGSTNMYANYCSGYGVTLTAPLGNLTTDLELTFSGKLVDPAADKWAAVPYDLDAGTYAYRWFDPSADYPMPDGGYPIIVWLHGSGEQGNDNNAQLTANRVTAWGEAETQDIFNGAYVIAPQAYSYKGTGTDPVPRTDGGAKIRGWQADSVINTIEAFIAEVGEDNVNRSDIVIGGCSMGGMGTWTTIKAYPKYFAAAYPVCGGTSFTADQAQALLEMPIYITHSVDDNTVNISSTISTYNALTAAGKENVYLALFEHVAGNGVPAEAAIGFLGHWSWMYNHNDYDASEEFWLDEFEYDGTVYETMTPAELGATSFKDWLAQQVKPDLYFTRDRDVMAYGETINGVTLYGIERIKATDTVQSWLAANPVTVTVDGETREIADYVVGEDRESLTIVFEPAGFTEPAGAITAKYVVTYKGEEVVYGGDEMDTSDFAAKSYSTSPYTRGGQRLTSMNARYYVVDKEAYPAPENGYPLVVWLHGGGETGTDNRSPVAANDVHAWTEPASQDIFGGAYVLAPQNHAAAGAGAPQATMDVILQFCEDMGDVDMSRIYVGGCSYGGGSTWTMLKTYPHFFAAGFPHCGGTTLTALDATNLINTPIYISVSTGDGNQAGANFIQLYNQLKAAGSEVVHIGLFEHSEFPGVEYFNETVGGGQPGFLDHWVWVYFHEDFDGEGDDYDGQNFIRSDVDGTYNYDGRRVEVKDGVLTAIYTSGEEEVSVVLEGKTESPVDLGYTSFKAWLADQKLADEFITVNKTVEAWGEIVSSLTLTLETPVVDTDSIKVEVKLAEETVEREITGVTASSDGTSVIVELDKIGAFAPENTTGYFGYIVTVDGREITDIQNVTSDVDKFEAITYTTPAYTWRGSNMTTMSARAFTPDKETYPMPEGGYPMIVWLHGGGEVGTDNRIQVAANDVPAWTEKKSQDIFGGAYVLAPQNHAAAGAGAPAATMSVIEQFMAANPDINPNRIYVGGCSYGGGSTWTMLKTYPTFFAAGFPHCGGTTLTAADISNLVNTPIYISVSTGDGNQAGANFISLYNQLKAGGSDVVHIGLFEHSEFDGVEYFNEVVAGGTEGALDHWVWVYFHEDFDGEGTDWDGQNWISSETDGTYEYDGRRVEVVDGVLTAYWNTTDADGNTVENTMVLEGETETPIDLGYTSFKAWLADQVKPAETITINKTVEAWGEIIGGVTLNLATPIVNKDSITVKVDTGAEELLNRAVTGVEVSEDGLTVTVTLDKVGAFAAENATTYQGYVVTVDGRTITYVGDWTSEVDRFVPMTFNTPAYAWNGTEMNTMNARAFTPDKETYPTPENGYPLIVWMHGGGEVGSDNRIHVAANDVPAWTEKYTQDIFGGAYVLAPQNHSYADLGDRGPAATMSVIQQFMAMNPDIDPTRVYIGGCSYGGRGTFEMIREYPNFFAAAFPTCASIYNPSTFELLTDEELGWLVDMPIYMSVSGGDNAQYVMSMITFYNNMKALGAENLYFSIFEHSVFEGFPEDMFPIGTLDHWVWVYLHDDYDAKGDDWDGKMFIDTNVDGTYNDGKIVVENGVLTYYYQWDGEDTSIVLNGSTSRPEDAGYATIKEWIAAQVNPTPSVFDDVPGDNEYYDAVMALYAAGITNGTSATTYEPNAPLTRAEFVTFLTRTLGVNVNNNADTGFTDVAVGSWETGSIAWGVENGVLLGYGDGTFGPNDPVTETQVNLIVGRLIEQETGVAGIEVIPGATDVPATRGLAATILAAFLAM